MSVAWRYLSSRRRFPTSISRPRREWWSFLCVRRCSVSSLIRAVSRAICTSAEPVSPGERPCLETISCFFSTVRVIGGQTVAEGSCGIGAHAGADLASLLDVGPHLLLEGLDRLEALLAPHPLDERHAQRLAVEVALEVDQVGLDEQPSAGLEHRPHADVD